MDVSTKLLWVGNGSEICFYRLSDMHKKTIDKNAFLNSFQTFMGNENFSSSQFVKSKKEFEFWSFAKDPGGSVWVSTNDYAVFNIHPKTSPPFPLFDVNVRHFQFDSTGAFFGTYPYSTAIYSASPLEKQPFYRISKTNSPLDVTAHTYFDNKSW